MNSVTRNPNKRVQVTCLIEFGNKMKCAFRVSSNMNDREIENHICRREKRTHINRIKEQRRKVKNFFYLDDRMANLRSKRMETIISVCWYLHCSPAKLKAQVGTENKASKISRTRSIFVVIFSNFRLILQVFMEPY